ncbi:hypothetical protein Pmani_032705 [Petrolisthes manimaculis]|uniref:Uncharacterized protein n=1 Tax=Petrolisthes manimaculis TaxID=1843537 RepID=A0AAE1TRF1_9EUCA|nr:hypothetical protein Pmani_032705 [Petrolisthes manimaculis]
MNTDGFNRPCKVTDCRKSKGFWLARGRSDPTGVAASDWSAPRGSRTVSLNNVSFLLTRSTSFRSPQFRALQSIAKIMQSRPPAVPLQRGDGKWRHVTRQIPRNINSSIRKLLKKRHLLLGGREDNAKPGSRLVGWLVRLCAPTTTTTRTKEKRMKWLVLPGSVWGLQK